MGYNIVYTNIMVYLQCIIHPVLNAYLTSLNIITCIPTYIDLVGLHSCVHNACEWQTFNISNLRTQEVIYSNRNRNDRKYCCFQSSGIIR